MPLVDAYKSARVIEALENFAISDVQEIPDTEGSPTDNSIRATGGIAISGKTYSVRPCLGIVKYTLTMSLFPSGFLESLDFILQKEEKLCGILQPR